MPSELQHGDQDYPSFGEIVETVSERESEYLRTEDPCRFLATELDEQARINGLESLRGIAVWKRAEYALAQHFGLEPRDEVIQLLEDRADELRRQQDTQAAIEAVEQAESESEVKQILMDEVSRKSPRKPVVAACNKRQDELRAAAAVDGGEVDE